MTERWYERYAWIVFLLIGVMGVVIALRVVVNPSAGAGVFEQLDGIALPPAIAASAEALAYVEFLYRFAFGATLGVDLMTILIAVFAFRHGRRWAWAAFCYWPLLFLTNLMTYDAPARYVQLFMLVITTAALSVTYRKTWRHSDAPVLPSPAGLEAT
jgi:hypothetical protein